MENIDFTPLNEEEKAQKTNTTDRQKTFLSYLHDMVFALVGILLVFMLLFRLVVVSGPSMRQTLENGDSLILLNNVLYNQPKYGDIVVACKQDYKNGEPIIKRVIATEGQTVDIDFTAGIVFVDGKALDEPYTNTPTNLAEGMTFPLTVEKGQLFVMGDNRNESKDSRDPHIGLIDEREILGRAIFLALPGVNPETGERDFSRIGVLN